jgi:hypothetical protein
MIRFIQASCVEGDAIDLRQSKLIARFKPDIVFFELPAGPRGPALSLNRFAPHRKPLAQVRAIQRSLKKASRQFGYARSDIATWEQIKRLWEQGKNTQIFYVDAPRALRKAHFDSHPAPYKTLVRQWQFWAYLYVREQYMARHIASILKKIRRPGTTNIAVLLEKIHWNHVQFLLKKPSKKQIWQFYFGRFP